MVCVVTGGCSASVSVRVAVDRTGQGSVSVTVAVPTATAAEVQDLQAGLPLGDLRRGGWTVQGPGPGPAGTTVVSARHAFSALSEVPVLVADIAGSGPIDQRPFRLAIAEDKGTLEDRFVASGVVDLRCSMSCFDDPRLAQDVGYPLGLPPAQLSRLLGNHPDRDLSFRFQVSLPGSTSASNALLSRKGLLVWFPALGRSTSLSATTDSVNEALVRELLIAIAAGALVVLATAAFLFVRRRRGGRRAPNGVMVTGRR